MRCEVSRCAENANSFSFSSCALCVSLSPLLSPFLAVAFRCLLSFPFLPFSFPLLPLPMRRHAARHATTTRKTLQCAPQARTARNGATSATPPQRPQGSQNTAPASKNARDHCALLHLPRKAAHPKPVKGEVFALRGPLLPFRVKR